MVFPSGNSKYYVNIHSKSLDKPVLLLLHGFMGSGRVFSHLIPRLASHFSPVTVDLAGHGYTKTPPEKDNFSTKNQVQQLHSVLGRLHAETIYLYGYSMGGRLALQLAVAFPGMFRGICVESSHCGIADETERLQRNGLDLEKVAQIRENFNTFTSRWAKLPLFSDTPERFKKQYLEISEAQDPDCMAACLQGFGAGVMPPVCTRLPEMKIPVHYMAGETDKKYVALMKQVHQQTGNSTFFRVDGAGHRVHTDQPDAVIASLIRLKENSFI